jgi:hypothetical protein
LSVQVYGVLLAGVIAIVAALLAQMFLAVVWPGFVLGVNLPFEAYSVVAAGLAAALISNRVGAGLRHGIGEVLAMAIATYFIAILLFPIVLAVWTWPSVSNGGEIQCVARGLSVCPHGLFGDAAMSALDKATMDYYGTAPIAFIILMPAAVGLLVPSTVWVVLMRRLLGDDSGADLYHRSV